MKPLDRKSNRKYALEDYLDASCTFVVHPHSVARPDSLIRRVTDAAIAAVVLVAADCAVRVLPFASIARRIGGELRSRAGEQDERRTIAHVTWAVDAARRRMPWAIRCLAVAVAANRLLAWRGVASEIRFGVRPTETAGIDAHAWLVAGGTIVTGADQAMEYALLKERRPSANN